MEKPRRCYILTNTKTGRALTFQNKKLLYEVYVQLCKEHNEEPYSYTSLSRFVANQEFFEFLHFIIFETSLVENYTFDLNAHLEYISSGL